MLTPNRFCDPSSVAEGLLDAQASVGGACSEQRTAVRDLCEGVSELVAREFDKELEAHQVYAISVTERFTTFLADCA